MNKRRLLVLVVALALLFTQFSMLTTVSAVSALSGRSTFAKGVCIHTARGFEEYHKQYDAILDAEALGANLIRTGAESDEYDARFAAIAYEHGMNTMFHLSLDVAFKNGSSFKTPAQIGQSTFQGVYDRFYARADALKDFDCYIQIGNELDLTFQRSSTGTSYSDYYSVDSVAIAIYLANKAVQDANAANGSNIKTILNFSYNHYGFLDAVKRVKINPSTYTTQSSSSGAVYADWDIVGLDYYSNMYDNATYQSIISTTKSKFGKNIIICEANLVATGMTGSTVNYSQNNSWLESFARYCYADSSIIGFCVYELYDEAHFESDNQFHREAHYGLIDKDGNKKSVYNLFRDLYGGTGVVADRTIPAAPAAPANYDICISSAGVSTTWGSDYISSGNRIFLDFTASPLNLNGCTQFEFDLYIEDYDAFESAAESKRINFAFSNHPTSKTKQRIRFDIANQIIQSGWNHIALPKSSRWQCDSGFDYDAVTYAMIFFQDGADEYDPISGSKVAIANLYGTTEEINNLPDWPEYEHLEMSRNGVTNYWGSSHPSSNLVLWTGTAGNDITVCDVSGTDKVEFDLYVKDYDTFAANSAGKDLRFCFGSSGGKWLEVHVLDKITHEGWNHIVAIWVSSAANPNSDRASINQEIDLTAIMQFRLRFNTSGSYTLTNYQARIANVCFTKSEINRLPDWPEYDHVKLSRQSNASNWGSGTSTFCVVWNGDSNPGVSQITTANATGTNYVEFDLYVENYDSYISRGDGKMLMFGIGSSGGKWRNVYIQNKIKHSGWNHIVADYTDGGIDYGDNANETTPDFSAIMQYRLKFYSSVTAPAGQVRIANVCFTSRDKIPDWPEYEHTEILRSMNPNWWGNGTGSSNHYLGGLTETDMSDTDQVEFDIYIDNYSKFASVTASGDVRFRFGSQGDNYIDVNVKSKITHDGWNHVVAVWLPSSTDSNTDRYSLTGSPNLTAIRWVKMYTTLNISWNSLCRTQIANVCFTKKPINRIPDWPEYEHIEILKSNTANWWGGSANNGNHLVTGLTETDMSATDQVEFDVYIDNYAGFVSQTAGGEIRFRFGSQGDNYIDVNVKNKITHDGWNHVIAVWLNSGVDPETDRYSLTGNPVLSAIRWVKLYSTVGINADVCGRTRIANVCFTKKEMNRIPGYPDDGAIELSSTPNENWWGGSYTTTASNFKTTLASPVDISDTRKIEFDIYIKDYDDFADAAYGHYLRFRFGSGSNTNDHIAVDVQDKILTAGWNHVSAIWVSNAVDPDTDRYFLSGSPDIHNISWIQLYWGETSGSNPIGSVTRVKIANVCGSKLISHNDDLMADKHSFIEAKSETAKFNGSGNYTADKSVNISGDTMIELDVFVRAYSPVTALTVALNDNASGAKSFSFTGLSNGWNHLAKKISDGTGSVNAANITGYTFSGTAGAVVYVSNLYTASYVEGDANRDGSVDVKDVVRTKLYLTSQTSKGNFCAMNVGGNPSAVDGLDIQNIRKYVMFGIWS